MGRILETSEKAWHADASETSDPRIGFARPLYEGEEISDGVFFVSAFANLTAVRTGEGLVLVDTGSFFTRARTHELVRGFDAGPLHTAVYTHGHFDHAFGLAPFLDEAQSAGQPRPTIVGHERVADRFDRYRTTHGYNACINRRQFGVPVELPSDFDYPDQSYRERLRLEVGGDVFELEHALGETDDHTWIFDPRRRVLYTGDQFIWVAPNAGNPQKVQRYPLEWAASLRAMVSRDAEILVPGHGFPIFGRERVRQAHEETAAWLEAQVMGTLERMNAGQPLDEILHEVRPPAELADRPYLQAVYDAPEYVVRNVWRLYGGWYDGTPSHLEPASMRDLGSEVAGLAGGATALAARAVEHAREGRWRVAGHLADWALAAAPDHPDVQRDHAEVYEGRAKQTRVLMTRGIYRDAARRSRPTDGAVPDDREG